MPPLTTASHSAHVRQNQSPYASTKRKTVYTKPIRAKNHKRASVVRDAASIKLLANRRVGSRCRRPTRSTAKARRSWCNNESRPKPASRTITPFVASKSATDFRTLFEALEKSTALLSADRRLEPSKI